MQQLEPLVKNFNLLINEQTAYAADQNFLHLFSAAKTGCESLLTLTVEMRRDLLAGLSKAHALISANLTPLKAMLADESAYQNDFLPALKRLLQATALDKEPAARLYAAAEHNRALIDLDLVDFSATIQTLHTLQNMTCFIYQELDFQENDAERIARLRLRLERISAGYGGVVLMGLNASPSVAGLELPAALGGVLGVSLVVQSVANMIA
jgi:hypothetical protein